MERAKPGLSVERRIIRKFLHDEGGATAIEYGLIAALVAVACVVVLEAIGASLGEIFDAVTEQLT